MDICFIYSLRHRFIGDLFMPDAEDKAVSNALSDACLASSSSIPSRADRYLPSFTCRLPLGVKGTENLPVDFSSNLALALQQLSNYFPAFVTSCSLHLSVKPAQHPLSLSLPISAMT